MSKILTYSLILAVLLLGSCHSSVGLFDRAGALSSGSVVDDLVESARNPEYCQYRMKLKANLNGSSVSANSTLKIDRGDLLMLTVAVPLLGVEIGRIEADRECVTIVDRLHKMYVRLSFEELSAYAGATVSLETLEALFLNNIFTLSEGNGRSQNRMSRLFSQKNLSETTLMLIQKGLDERLAFELNINPLQLKRTVMDSGQGASMEWMYDDFSKKGELMFPGSINVEVATGSERIRLDMNIQQVSTDKTVLRRMDLSRYKEASLQQCLKLIEQL